MTKAHKPRISVITPSLNQGSFLEETITSVLDQGYPALEYIVIDGGSKDNSVDIIKKYEKHLAYWISEPDAGQTHAINKGLKRITGDIWGYLCSDDTYLPEAFEKCVQAFQERNPDVVYGNCNFINAEGTTTRRKHPGSFDRVRLLRGNFLFQPSMFLKRWILEEFGLFDESLRYAMDYEYWLRISSQVRITYLNETLSNYRLHPESKSMNAIQGMNEEGRRVRHQYGVGIMADVSYYTFKWVGAAMYRARRRFFEMLAKGTTVK